VGGGRKVTVAFCYPRKSPLTIPTHFCASVRASHNGSSTLAPDWRCSSLPPSRYPRPGTSSVNVHGSFWCQLSSGGRKLEGTINQLNLIPEELGAQTLKRARNDGEWEGR
jgi:hypothetical protein